MGDEPNKKVQKESENLTLQAQDKRFERYNCLVLADLQCSILVSTAVLSFAPFHFEFLPLSVHLSFHAFPNLAMSTLNERTHNEQERERERERENDIPDAWSVSPLP